MVNFCHIAPTAFLGAFTRTNGAHLILAHLVEQDPVYRDFYANLDDGKQKIMDNSAFEMYKQGRPMYSTDDLLPMAEACDADMIVMSDYPGEHSSKTIAAAEETGPIYHREGYDTFFVPQSEVGDLEDYLYCMEWALDDGQQYVDRIGLSILGCPNAFGVEKDNKLQRYMSRYRILELLTQRGCFNNHRDVYGIFHCLGMVDGPNEISLLEPFHRYIATWDSSAAVWAGLNNIRFDNSPTGLIDGKFEREVEFDFPQSVGPPWQHVIGIDHLNAVTYNINYIDELVGAQ